MRYVLLLLLRLTLSCAVTGISGRTPPVVVSVAPLEDGRLLVRRCKIDIANEELVGCKVQHLDKVAAPAGDDDAVESE